MPYVFTIAEPLYFNYNNPDFISNSIQSNENIHIHYHINSNDNEIALLSNNQYKSPPIALFQLPSNILQANTAYSFIIYFKFADSPINRQIGMFMIHLNLKDKHGDILTNINRPLMIPYRSSIYRYVKSFIVLLPSLLGLYEESYEITVPCIQYYWEDSKFPIKYVEISISHPDIQLYESTLYIETQLFGIHYVLHYYYFPTCFFIVFCIFTFEWFILLLCLLIYQLRKEDNNEYNPHPNPIVQVNNINQNNRDNDIHINENNINENKINNNIKQQLNKKDEKDNNNEEIQEEKKNEKCEDIEEEIKEEIKEEIQEEVENIDKLETKKPLRKRNINNSKPKIVNIENLL